MKRFLIIKPSSLGDVIHAFPAVTMLAQQEPDSEIDWMIAPQFAPVVRYHPAVRNLIFFHRRDLGTLRRFPATFFNLVSDLRKNRYDAVIDLQGLLRSSIISEFARTPMIAGPAMAREAGSKFFYRKKLRYPEDTLHAVRKNAAMMADFLGIPVPETLRFEFPVNPSDSQRARALLSKQAGARFIAIAPGARWHSKQWPGTFFAEAATLLHAEFPDHFFVLLGTRDEIPQGNELIANLQFPVLNLIGRTSVGELIEVIRKARLLLCNDSGPMHIAAAAGTPLIANFGPTDPDLTGPFSDKAVVLQPSLECIRCFHRDCEERLCHQGIDVQRVLEAARQLLG